MKKSLTMLLLIIAFALVSTSCGSLKRESVIDSTNNNGGSDTDSTENNELYGIYTYPENPVAELKSFLENDIIERELPLELGDIEEVEWNTQERMEFLIYFKNDPDNLCLVSFNITYYEYGGYPLSGTGNPSFTLAFKDPDKPQDMVTVLTSVILYISPELGLKEAERLAHRQDDTISIDGYSMPQDIGGYQVQAHYTNPHTYFTTKDFTASLGVTVKALQQIWRKESALDVMQCRELSSTADFRVLDDPYSLYDRENNTSETVYADFTVKDWWEYQEPIHGDWTTYITVESPYGTEHLLCIDPWQTPYAFGIGEKYTMFIYYYYGGARISHAIQLTEGA